MDNDQRRGMARVAVDKYRILRASADPGYRGEPDEAVIGDMLTDLRHLCAADDIDFASKIISSEVNFESER